MIKRNQLCEAVSFGVGLNYTQSQNQRYIEIDIVECGECNKDKIFITKNKKLFSNKTKIDKI